MKDILIKCSEILNRSDITKVLKSVDSVDNISDSNIQDEVIKLIGYFNFVTHSIYQNYINLTRTETLKSDENNKIHYYNFSYNPIKIVSAFDENHNRLCATVLSGYILTNSANKTYNITYNYIPDEAKDLNSDVFLPKQLSKRIICYGIVSEFYACKNMFTESEFWKSKFLFEIFKLKTQKERRLKSTFSLWVKP